MRAGPRKAGGGSLETNEPQRLLQGAFARADHGPVAGHNCSLWCSVLVRITTKCPVKPTVKWRKPCCCPITHSRPRTLQRARHLLTCHWHLHESTLRLVMRIQNSVNYVTSVPLRNDTRPVCASEKTFLDRTGKIYFLNKHGAARNSLQRVIPFGKIKNAMINHSLFVFQYRKGGFSSRMLWEMFRVLLTKWTFENRPVY